MKTTKQLAVTGALAAAVVATSGCRTIRSSDSYYPTPKNQPAEALPAETAVEPVAVPPATVSVAPEKPAAKPAPVPAGAAVAAAPGAPVQDAATVGTPGTYREFVITDDGSDRSYMFESNGLQGQTGRHVPKPAPAPDPVVKPAPAPAGSGYYVVQEGDIFGRIAQKHGVTQAALRAANPSLTDPNKIRVGQKLAIPAPGAAKPAPKAPAAKPAPAAKKAPATLPEKPGYVVYVVQDGDILGRVARKHGTTVKAIMDANGISDDRKVRAGKAIYVPSGAAPAPVPSAAAPAPVPSAAAVPPVPEPVPEPVPADPYLSL